MLKHWKGTIVCFLVGALALGVFNYFHSPKEAAEVTGEAVEVTEEAQATEMIFAERKAVDVALEYEELYLQAKESGDVENLLELNKAIIDSVKAFNDMQLQYFTENSFRFVGAKPFFADSEKE